ncbi:hypothetical protein CSB07_01540 [Candidatus Gracilibacteria bacterium]|nr:MAG: hypothetical protein CSB07_01540 [Candidatus Gracilibacteria bacterium]PIE85037.1 MAG: hypothetical protein CSA08_03800 [Candidatus Gracilibacteria bacterium]
MNNIELLNEIVLKIKSGDSISPFLFLGRNQDLVNSDVYNLGLNVLKEFDIPKNYLYRLEDNGENIKIEDIKKFLDKGNLRSYYKCQIFLIENISRFTLSASNNCLKFFEEPGIGNIIFLTNSSESQILDTIISRVTEINYSGVIKNISNEFYISLLDNYIKNKDYSLFSYFFKEKLEKKDYISFLDNIIFYSKETGMFDDILSSLEEDINAIKNNNVSAKFIVDKYLLEIKLKK